MRRKQLLEGSVVLWVASLCFLACCPTRNLLSLLVSASPSPKDRRILLLDVDNTLYNEKDHLIEKQIVQNIHEYCQRELQVSPEECDRLHHEYGSTIEGLMNLKNTLVPLDLSHFYQQVYQNIRVDSLLTQYSLRSVPTLSTGYTHDFSTTTSQQRKRSLQLQHFLLALASSQSLGLASNSPQFHISKVIQALGWTQIPWKHVLTPDSPPTRSTFSYPTKFSSAFFEPLQRQENTKITLVDDSKRICQLLRRQMRTIRVDHEQENDSNSLWKALLLSQHYLSKEYSFCQHYNFDTVQYLQEKNKLDLQSIHPRIWKQVVHELVSFQKDTIQIVDLGAGLLSMLFLMDQGSAVTTKLPPLFPSLRASSIVYHAYEPNRELERECIRRLERNGFRLIDTVKWHPTGTKKEDENSFLYDPEYVFQRDKITVHLKMWDYRTPHDELTTSTSLVHPDLIVGCCFADLMNSRELAETVLKRFCNPSKQNDSSLPHSTLIYFPITFAGVTQFEPPSPFQGKIPSDTLAFSLYSQALANIHEHELDPLNIVQAFNDFGGTLLDKGQSDWVIEKKEKGYLWYTMMHFFGSVAAPAIKTAGWNATGWIERSHSFSPTIRASNVDLLFRLPYLGNWRFPPLVDQELPVEDGTFDEILFTAPHKVKIKKRDRGSVGPNEIRIKSEYSLISSGTELKIFKGLFEDSPLDVNIKSMEGERMVYPMSYGYSLVGRVVDCGELVADRSELVGSLVFTFSPHSTEVIASRDAVQLVPEGVSPLDAIFFPSVETALSIVHDAQLRLGERCAVFGQGIIGLLVTAILRISTTASSDSHREFLGSITTFDFLPQRLVQSSVFGASQALLPDAASSLEKFDVSIEVSGNPNALQSAIDCTADGGRVGKFRMVPETFPRYLFL